MRTLLPITLTTLLLAATAVSAQAQTDPTNPNVVAPDGVCTRIPNPADLNGPDIPDETDPDCHEAGLIYQEVPDTHIDARVDTTGTDWATACRALGVTVGPLPAGHGGPEPHTFESTTTTRAVGGATSGCTAYTVWIQEEERRDRTVYDCREASAHSTAAGDGHAHTWIAEPWGAMQTTELTRWWTADPNACLNGNNPTPGEPPPEPTNGNPAEPTNGNPGEPTNGNPGGSTDASPTQSTDASPADTAPAEQGHPDWGRNGVPPGLRGTGFTPGGQNFSRTSHGLGVPGTTSEGSHASNDAAPTGSSSSSSSSTNTGGMADRPY